MTEMAQRSGMTSRHRCDVDCERGRDDDDDGGIMKQRVDQANEQIKSILCIYRTHLQHDERRFPVKTY